jgi:hypothetical protein
MIHLIANHQPAIQKIYRCLGLRSLTANNTQVFVGLFHSY